MSKKKYRTDFLFPKSNFWIGMGSIMNVRGSYFEFNYFRTDEEADSKAIEADWGVIGQDLEFVIANNLSDKPHREYAS